MALTTLLFLISVLAAEWSTYGGDPQRTGWAHGEEYINHDNVSKLKLAWSLHLDSARRELNALTPPVVSFKTITNKGFKEYVIVGGADDKIFAIDADSGKIAWSKQFDNQAGKPPSRQSYWLCPDALEATPYFDRKTNTVYVISVDGRLHSLNVINGEDRAEPVAFIPPFSKPWSLNMHHGTLYTALSQGCARGANGVYAMDLKDPAHPVQVFKTTGGIWGRGGVTIGSNGRVYAEIGDGPFDIVGNKWSDAVIALEPKTLKLADYYVPANRWKIDNKDLDMGNITPTVFPWKDTELIAAAGKEGVIYLLNTRALGGPDHGTPLYRSPLYTNEEIHFAGRGFWGAFATWQNEGVRWLYVPAYGPRHPNSPSFPMTNGDAKDGSIMAFTVDEKDGKPVLNPVWMSRDMIAPDPPVIVNGVVFALSTGDDTDQVKPEGGLLDSESRAKNSKPAVLYAFDAKTGKTLFSSDDEIKAFTHFSGLAIAEGKVYVVTADSTVYAFGLDE